MVTGSTITNEGLKIMMDRTYNDDGSTTYTAPLKFKIGIKNVLPLVTDTALQRPVPLSGTETVDDLEATTGWVAGTDTTVSLNTTLFKENLASLNITKTGTTGTTFSTSKTVTSRDYTSKDLHSWVYVSDLSLLVASGTAVNIRYGSDSSNYFQFDIALTSLSVGWNVFFKASGDASSTTGTPSLTVMDYYEIIFHTDLAADTTTAGTIMIDDLKLVSSDDYLHTFEAGSPSINESTKEVETQCKVLSTEANGYDVNALGIFNTDTPPKMFGEDTFIAESKSNTDEFLFIVKDRFIHG